MHNRLIKDKNNDYYNHEKTIIQGLIPKGNHTILDVGCAKGRLGKQLLVEKKAKIIIGVELVEDVGVEAKKLYSEVYIGDLEKMELPYDNYFDYIICADVLEHLYDPWASIAKLNRYLKKDGRLIVSIPNIRYRQIIFDLVMRGEWDYVDAGILDNTHLRFFTNRTFTKALVEAGHRIISRTYYTGGRKNTYLNKLTLGFFKEFLSLQIVFVSSKTN